MANISFGEITGGFNMSTFNISAFHDYEKSKYTSTQFKVYNAADDYSLIVGTGLTYKTEGGKVVALTGGTITSFKAVSQGETFFSFTGLKISAKAFSTALFNSNTPAFLDLILAGNDTVTGSSYADLLFGGPGNDVLKGGAGSDMLEGGIGADNHVGGDGFDQVSYYNSRSGVTASLSKPSINTGEAKGDTYSSIEDLYGSKFADKLYGDGNSNWIYGDNGKDLLDGAGGDDTLIGGAGADRLVGGSGNDTAYYYGATKGLVASLSKPSISTGDAAGDTYSSIENVGGTAFDDKLYGNGSANFLGGGEGNDTLSGGGGDDFLAGQAGADDLYGGSGRDRFSIADMSYSTVATKGRDTIFDFSGADGDVIDISGIDANTKISGNQAFSFIGTKAFSGKSGELRYEKKASDTYIYGDVNGDGKADFAIHLDDAVTLQKGYFVL